MKYAKFVSALLVCFFIWSCGGTDVDVIPIVPLGYPPTQTCEVFTAKAPDRPFIEIALLEVATGDDSIQLAQQKAMSIGADAIVMKGTEETGSRTSKSGRMTYTWTKTIFVAIKWKE